MTHGMIILLALREEMRRLARKPSDVESAAVIDDYLAAQGIKLKRVKKPGAVKPRARDGVFDLLAKCDGIPEGAKLTRMAGSRLAGAKKQIVDAMLEDDPNVTTDQVVAEIEKRWARYCREYREKRMQTAMALVSHWGKFADADRTDRAKTKAELMNIYLEPTGDWRRVAAIVIKCDRAVLDEKQWLDLSPDYRTAVLKDMTANGRVSA